MADHDDGRYSYDGLDRVLHEKARLGILTALMSHRQGIAFTDLARLCTLTDGNLSRHLDVLAGEDLVKIEKSFVARRPHTACKLTPTGRKRFQQYIAELERVLRDAAAQASEAKNLKPGLAEA